MKQHHVITLPLILLTLLTLTTPLAADWEEGVAAFQAGQYHEAVVKFRDVVTRSPESPQGYYMLGLSMVQQRQAKAALEPLQKAVELASDNAQYRLTLAQAQIKARDNNGALRTLAALDPGRLAAQQLPSFNKLVARSAGDSDELRLAVTTIEGALKKSPKERDLHLALALVEGKRGRGAAEWKALAAAYELDSSDTDLGRRVVRKAFALAADATGDARQDWYLAGAEIARKLQGDPAEVALLVGEAEMSSKNFAAARASFEAAASADSDNALPHFYLGRCALAEGQAEAALGHLNGALARSPEADLLGQVHAVRGLTLRHLERFEEAAAAYRDAGNAGKAAEMEELMAAQAQNAEWEKEKKRCVLQRKQLEELMAESQDLKGSDTWRELEQQHTQVVEICAQFF